MSIHFLKMSRILHPADSASTGCSWSLGCTSGAKVSLVGLLIAVAMSIEAADRVLLTGLCSSLCWRLHPPGRGRQRRTVRKHPVAVSFLCCSPSKHGACTCAVLLVSVQAVQLFVGLLPHEVALVEAIPSGWAVRTSPLWRDEGVGSVWGHKQI